MFQKLIQALIFLKTRQCRIILQNPNAKLPEKGSELAAGYDLHSAEDITIPAHGRALVHTGLLVAPPPHCHIEIRPRSGLALKHGLTVLNTPGTIDADYRGEIMVVMFNTTDSDFQIHIGDRIAQAVVMKHENVQWIPVEHFDQTDRGSNGFGSTGTA